MSGKPNVVPQTTVVDQVKGLLEQQYTIETQIGLIHKRLKLVEASLAENDHLALRVKELLAESLQLFAEEYQHKIDLFPDIWLGSMEKALAVVAPVKKK